MRKNLSGTVKFVFFAAATAFCFSACSKKNTRTVSRSMQNIRQIEELHVSHEWFCFDGNSIKETELPSVSASASEKPWTEAVRISCAASVPESENSLYKAYALVNRCGLIGFTEDGADLFRDNSLFLDSSVQGLVFSSGSPVFYLYRSTFFFDEKKVSNAASGVQTVRPFLVEFDSRSKNFYPLVSYENMNLEKEDQVTGCFWNGDVWVVGVKNGSQSEIQFKYLWWKPPVALGDLNPALGGENFFIRKSSEQEYLSVCLPKLFEEAPLELKILLKTLPESFSFYVSYRDDSGTTPVSYYHEGKSEQTVNAVAMTSAGKLYSSVVFADGTVFVKKSGIDKVSAFRLPKLPDGFVYGEAAVAGDVMYAAWEEGSSWQTKRSGFIKVNLADIL